MATKFIVFFTLAVSCAVAFPGYNPHHAVDYYVGGIIILSIANKNFNLNDLIQC